MLVSSGITGGLFTKSRSQGTCFLPSCLSECSWVLLEVFPAFAVSADRHEKRRGDSWVIDMVRVSKSLVTVLIVLPVIPFFIAILTRAFRMNQMR